MSERFHMGTPSLGAPSKMEKVWSKKFESKNPVHPTTALTKNFHIPLKPKSVLEDDPK